MRKNKKWFTLLSVAIVMILAGCGGEAASGDSNQVVILSNGDEEAVNVMEETLNDAGFEGDYLIQSLGTSELGGKLLAEGKSIEADIVTMSSYFLESAEKQHDMFKDLSFDTSSLVEYPNFYTPLLANTGSLFYNTSLLEQKGLEVPTSIKELAEPQYEGLVSIPNIMDSSTGWMLIQAIISEYGEETGKKVMAGIIKNAGPHLESSGSGSIKKVQAGEVAVGFGLRHQAVAAKTGGAPIDFIDPTEGNFSTTESIAVIDKGEEQKELAEEMAEVLVKEAREGLIDYYPVALYDGETVADENIASNQKIFSEPMTVELLEKHQAFFNSAK
ncbi:extracellular solute-binding protein [Cytobacillus kochii]|uniref:extracellular solute-binding protein n=1 Tax=Cytobacillus kochii TaxID=859143 RepID=UPI002781BEF8|nr:extracellular solute-binding protein [Cytobacillus kochii]MDQ0187556.1 iron(III) transport system substrate-binding protein [Cytobacillus kochii]